MSSEDTHAGMTVREQEDGISVCCVCGCEDNEYFEPLVGFSPHFNLVSIQRILLLEEVISRSYVNSNRVSHVK